MCCKCRADLSIVTRRLYLFRGRMAGSSVEVSFLSVCVCVCVCSLLFLFYFAIG